MRACYDLRLCSPTWDFATFLASAEIERLNRGEEHIDLVFAPGPNQGFRNNKLPPYTREEREAMFENVVLPLTNLMPSVKSVERLQDRTCLDDAWGFERKHIGVQEHLRVLKNPNGRRMTADAKGEDYITVTLREAPYYPKRNSDVMSWLEASKRIPDRVIFVRDHYQAGLFMDAETAHDASRNVLERAKLYAGAKLNCFVPNGPMVLSLYMDLPTLIFWKGGSGAAEPEYLRQCGLADQYPGPDYQRICWEPESPEAIAREVCSLTKP